MAHIDYQRLLKRFIGLVFITSSVMGVERATAVTTRQLVEVVDFSSPVVSPRGDMVAFRTERASIERNTYDTVWYVQNMGGQSPPRRVSDGGVPLRDTAGISLPADVVWSSDERWIYYRAFIDGTVSIWRAATDGSGSAQMTRDPADIRRFVLDQAGGVLKYSVGATRDEVIGAEQAEYDRGIRIDQTVPIGQGLFRSGAIEGRLATQRYGAIWFDRTSLLGDRPNVWKATDLATGQSRVLAPSEIPPDPDEIAELDMAGTDVWRVAQDFGGKRIAVLTRVGEPNELRQKPDVQLSVVGKAGHVGTQICRAKLCTHKAITSVDWRPDRDEVLFTVTDPDAGLAQSVYRWDLTSDVVALVLQSDGLINGGREISSHCGVSTRAMACVTADANQPPRLERIDLQSGDRRMLFEPNAELARDVKSTGRARLLHWTDPKGQVFTGQYYPTPAVKGIRPPLFVNYYKCTGFVRGGLGDEWPLATLAEHGISALCINSAPSVFDAEERYGNGLAAVASAINLLSAGGEIDCSHVGMGGLSFGSEVAMWVAMKTTLLSAVSVSSPSVSPNYYLLASLKGSDFFRSLHDIWGLGPPSDTPKRWHALSPAFNLERIGAPILLQMPEQEYMQALDYVIPLMRQKRADLYVFPNEPHQKFQPKHKQAVYERNLDWFRFWLQGYEDPDPSKSIQYQYWHQMQSSLKKVRSSKPMVCDGHIGH